MAVTTQYNTFYNKCGCLMNAYITNRSRLRRYLARFVAGLQDQDDFFSGETRLRYSLADFFIAAHLLLAAATALGPCLSRGPTRFFLESQVSACASDAPLEDQRLLVPKR